MDEMKHDEDILSENSEPAENMADQAQAPAQDASLEKVHAELTEQKDKFIRLYSEFENFRRRTAKEKLELIQTANEHLIKNLLPVLDDFARAEKSLWTKTKKSLKASFSSAVNSEKY